MKVENTEIIKLKHALLRANEDIENLSRIKSDFISIISHELRTPLTSIKESVSLVLEGIAGPINEDQKKFLDIAKSNIGRLTRIITDILDFSKLESGKVTMHKRKLDVNELIKNVFAAVRHSVEQRGLKLELELSDGMEPVWFDPDRIGQVLRNLISNAIKFNRENGRIKIRSDRESRTDKSMVRITVEDAGVGIPKERLSDLFKRFTPLDTSMTRNYRGVGLGLVICKGIVGLHGGDIWAESEMDIGSKFIFTLPIYKKEEEFDFLLNEAIERAKYNNLKLALIIFDLKNRKGITEEVLDKFEKDISSAIRGPEDKVIRFKDKDLIAVLAGTDISGAMKIIKRIKERVRIPLNLGLAIYPDETDDKQALVKKAEEDLKNRRNSREVRDG